MKTTNKSTIDVALFEKMYYAGTKIEEMAAELGVAYSVLYSWMQKHRYATICPMHQEILEQMYKDGATDLEMIVAIDRSMSAIIAWRESKKLRKNRQYKGGRPKKEVQAVEV